MAPKHPMLVGWLVLCGCKGSAPGTPGGTASVSSTTATTATPTTKASALPAPIESAAAAGPGKAAAWGFDRDEVSAAPKGMSFARTGQGKDGRWWVVDAADSPSQPHVLAQLDADPTDLRFPVAVIDGLSLGDVRVSVSCKTVSGSVDQACGLLLRYRDAQNYYVTRANALEDNVRLYSVKDGIRVQLSSWSGKVTPKRWHRLRMEARGDHLEVHWDETKVIDARDATFVHAGRVGLWTKADSVTWFDDLTVTPL